MPEEYARRHNTVSVPLHIPPPCPVLGVGLFCNLMILIRGPFDADQQQAGDPQVAT